MTGSIGANARDADRQGRAPHTPTEESIDTLSDLAVNSEIRAGHVRLINQEGRHIGVVDTATAIRLAEEEGLDLVAIAPEEDPPVAKILDYGKLRYEASVRARESRKSQSHVTTKESKLRPRIDAHDLGIKTAKIRKFLQQGHHVRVTLTFRGREQTHPEIGYRLLAQVQEGVADVGSADAPASIEGRTVSLLMVPGRGRGVKPSPANRR